MCCTDRQHLSVRPYLLRIFHVGMVWLHVLTCFLQSGECPTSQKGINCLSIFLASIVWNDLKLEQRGIWHCGGQNLRVLFELCPVRAQLELQEQIPRNAETWTTPKANRATHNPQICTSANDRARWLWGCLAQVSP